VLDVDVGGVVNGLRAFVPRLVAAGRPAHLLDTASLAGLTVFPGGGAYGPSEHAVVAVVSHAAMALPATPVTISMICPALVASGTSSEGVAPAGVAAEALDAVDAGTFTTFPQEWRAAVTGQAEEIAAGGVPTPPTPPTPG
jgi:NADP-dependent 3-hydroxy acid dehydrogenase YdfG